MKATIYTCNTSQSEDGTIKGGYHEIHSINYLQSVDHLVATVCDVIKNNLLYGCKDSVLEDVVIMCDDEFVVEHIKKNYNKVFCCFEFKPKIEFDHNM